MLLSQVDEHYGLSAKVAGCFRDHRHGSYVEYSIETLVKQRLYGLAQGYGDLNDHEHLRHDPLFGVALGRLESAHRRCAPSAEQMLRAFRNITLYDLPDGTAEITPVNPLQQRILALMNIPEAIYDLSTGQKLA